MKFFCPNIGLAGRIVRAVFGLGCLLAGLLLRKHSLWLCGALIAMGILGLFEAIRGWCVVRACGLRTKI